MPGDLKLPLKKEASAWKELESLNKIERFVVLWRIETSSERSRDIKIDTIVGMLEREWCWGRKNGRSGKAGSVLARINASNPTSTQNTPRSRRNEHVASVRSEANAVGSSRATLRSRAIDTVIPISPSTSLAWLNQRVEYTYPALPIPGLILTCRLLCWDSSCLVGELQLLWPLSSCRISRQP